MCVCVCVCVYVCVCVCVCVLKICFFFLVHSQYSYLGRYFYPVSCS